MPEYSEVFTISRDLKKYIGDEITTYKSFNSKRFQSLNLKGYHLIDIIRYGKLIQFIISKDKEFVSRYLLFKSYTDGSSYSISKDKIRLLENSEYKVLNLHLGMTGQLSTSPFTKNQRVIFSFCSGRSLYFKDNRMFGRVYLSNNFKLPSNRDPLNKEFFDYLYPKVKESSRMIFSILIDQSYFLGVGSYLAQEALFMSNISPFARNLTYEKYQTLVVNLQQIIKLANKERGASISDYYDLKGRRGNFQKHFMVYGRLGESCLACAGFISRGIISGRGVYYCKSCQS